jgi:hypothetical protein
MSRTFDGSLLPWHGARPLSQRYRICVWTAKGFHCVAGLNHDGPHRTPNDALAVNSPKPYWRLCPICYLGTRTKQESK